MSTGRSGQDGTEPPDVSYVLWYSPRSGSNLVCDAMRFTGCAGDPQELLSTNKILNLLAHYQVRSYADAQRALWRAGIRGGVFGMKCQMFDPDFSRIVSTLRQFPGGESIDGMAALWSNAFPNCHHVAVTRRNKVRQAVSWYRATVSKEWTREPGAPPPVRDVTDLYNRAHIQRYMLNAVMADAMMSEFFVTSGIRPHVLIYEDFVADADAAIVGMFDFLGLDYTRAERVEPILERQADELSEAWVQRFRADQQVGWARRW
jgi:trehalose 2-sulfotransferase